MSSDRGQELMMSDAHRSATYRLEQTVFHSGAARNRQRRRRSQPTASPAPLDIAA
jgi:hypothetical protein